MKICFFFIFKCFIYRRARFHENKSRYWLKTCLKAKHVKTIFGIRYDWTLGPRTHQDFKSWNIFLKLFWNYFKCWRAWKCSTAPVKGMKACERGMSTYLLPLANSDSYLSGFQVCSAKRIEMASLVGRPYDTMSLKVPKQIVPPHCTAVSETCCLSTMFLS